MGADVLRGRIPTGAGQRFSNLQPTRRLMEDEPGVFSIFNFSGLSLRISLKWFGQRNVVPCLSHGLSQ